jgi:hypothetical protein
VLAGSRTDGDLATHRARKANPDTYLARDRRTAAGRRGPFAAAGAPLAIDWLERGSATGGEVVAPREKLSP